MGEVIYNASKKIKQLLSGGITENMIDIKWVDIGNGQVRAHLFPRSKRKPDEMLGGYGVNEMSGYTILLQEEIDHIHPPAASDSQVKEKLAQLIKEVSVTSSPVKDLPKHTILHWIERKGHRVFDVTPEKSIFSMHTKLEDRTVEEVRKAGDKLVVADFGSGAGGLTKKVAALENVKAIYAVDVNAEALVRLRQRIQGPNAGKVTVLNMDIYDSRVLQLISGVDVVVSLDTLFHLSDLDKAVGMMAGRLAPGGTFIGNFLAREKAWSHYTRTNGYVRGVYKVSAFLILQGLWRKGLLAPAVVKHFAERGWFRTFFQTEERIHRMMHPLFARYSVELFNDSDYYVVARKSKSSSPVFDLEKLSCLQKVAGRYRDEALTNQAAGIFTDPETGGRKYYKHGRPFLHLDADVYVKKGSRWNIPAGVQLPEEFSGVLDNENGSFVFLAGPAYEIEKGASLLHQARYIRALNDEEMYKRFGLKRVVDAQQRPFTMPMLGIAGRSILLPVPAVIRVNKEGAIVTRGEELKGSGTKEHKAFGLEFKGAGTPGYAKHNLNDTFEPTVFKEHVGKPGIFLDWEHQLQSGTPVGLETPQGISRMMERERRVLSRGGRLTRHTIGVLPLFDRYGVVMRLPVGDYRRLSLFFDAYDKGRPEILRGVVAELGMPPDAYASLLRGNYLRNLDAILKAGILQGQHGSIGNLDILGQMADIDDFFTIKNVSQDVVDGAVENWKNNLQRVLGLIGTEKKTSPPVDDPSFEMGMDEETLKTLKQKRENSAKSNNFGKSSSPVIDPRQSGFGTIETLLGLGVAAVATAAIGVGAYAVAGTFVAAAGIVYVAAKQLGVLAQIGNKEALERLTNAPNGNNAGFAGAEELLVFAGNQRDTSFGVIEDNDKTVEDVFSAQKVEADIKFGGKSYRGVEGNPADTYREDMKIYWNYISVPYHSAALPAFGVVYAEPFSLLDGENRVESSGIDIGVNGRFADIKSDDRTGYVIVGFVGEFYRMIRAHINSWGYGTRKNKGVASGNSLLTRFPKSRGEPSLLVYTILPLTAIMNPPAYLSTNSLKCLVSHWSLLKTFNRFIFSVPFKDYSKLSSNLNMSERYGQGGIIFKPQKASIGEGLRGSSSVMMAAPVLTDHDLGDNKREDKKPAEQNIYSHYPTSRFNRVAITYPRSLVNLTFGSIRTASLGVLAQGGIQEDLARKTNAPNFEAMKDEGRGARDEADPVNDDVSGGIGRWQSRSRKPGRSSRMLPVRITFYSSLLSGQPRIPGGAAPLGAMISGDGRGIDRFQTTRQLPRLWWLPLIGLLKTFYSSVVTKLLPTSSRLRLVKNPFIFIPSIVAPFRIVKIAEIVLVPGFDGKIQLNLVDAWAYFSGRAPAALNFIKTKLSALAFKMSVWFERFDEWAKTQPKKGLVVLSLKEAMDAGDRVSLGAGTGYSEQEMTDEGRKTKDEITNSPVGAVVASSSSPVVDVNDLVWAEYVRAHNTAGTKIVSVKDLKVIADMAGQMAVNAKKFSFKAAHTTTNVPAVPAALPQTPAVIPVSVYGQWSMVNGQWYGLWLAIDNPAHHDASAVRLAIAGYLGYGGNYLLAGNRRGHQLSFRDPPAIGTIPGE